MRVIDARTGTELKIGDSVTYPEGDSLMLVDVDEGLFSATATIRYRNEEFWVTRMIPLEVRLMHPKFFLRRVAFLMT